MRKLIEHLERVYEDLVFGSYPKPFRQIVDEVTASAWMLADDGRSHNIVTVDERTPHRAMVSVAVEREVRGQGRGLKELEAAAAWASSMQGCEYLDGWLWEDNAAALAMDLKFGFEVVGRIPDAWRYPDGRSRTVLLVSKRIA